MVNNLDISQSIILITRLVELLVRWSIKRTRFLFDDICKEMLLFLSTMYKMEDRSKTLRDGGFYSYPTINISSTIKSPV